MRKLRPSGLSAVRPEWRRAWSRGARYLFQRAVPGFSSRKPTSINHRFCCVSCIGDILGSSSFDIRCEWCVWRVAGSRRLRRVRDTRYEGGDSMLPPRRLVILSSEQLGLKNENSKLLHELSDRGWLVAVLSRDDA
jgi:hypothetical protein